MMVRWDKATAVVAMAGSLVVAACNEEGDARAQWVVTVSTDAPVPQLGDVLLVEVLGEGGSVCASCRRLFAVRDAARWPVSFGILPGEGQTPARVRARLYRSIATGLDGVPAGTALIDATGKLPALDGLTEVSLELRMDCFGLPVDLAGGLSCDPATGELAPEPMLALTPAAEQLPQIGSWPQAQDVPCSGEAPADMVCVPGGVFLLGGYHYVPTPIDWLHDPLPERLVRLSPFFLDRDEVTVETVRTLVPTGALTAEPDIDPAGTAVTCTYPGEDSAHHDPWPLNCVSQLLAREVCAAQGKRLPTEAQWEFAASNRAAETIYPWGNDAAPCAYALVGRGNSVGVADHTVCIDELGGDPGLQPGGFESDQTTLGIRNLGGSLAEWVDDTYLSYADACWSTERLLVDPTCPGGSVGTRVSVRGGAWHYLPGLTRSIQRNGIENNWTGRGVGFRCAMSAAP